MDNELTNAYHRGVKDEQKKASKLIKELVKWVRAIHGYEEVEKLIDRAKEYLKGVE